jgi:hypothetical protein
MPFGSELLIDTRGKRLKPEEDDIIAAEIDSWLEGQLEAAGANRAPAAPRLKGTE